MKVACSPAIVALVEDRAHHWQMLRFLAGHGEAEQAAEHRAQMEALAAKFAASEAAREESLDSIAAAMAELASSAAAAPLAPLGLGGGFTAGAPATPPAPAPTGGGASDRPIWLDPADEPKCNDCATCYQELPQLFEKATIMVDGAAKTVGRMKPGALEGFEVTADVAKRIARVKSTCDAEIIQ